MFNLLHVSKDGATVLGDLLWIILYCLVNVFNMLSFDLIDSHSPEVVKSLPYALFLLLVVYYGCLWSAWWVVRCCWDPVLITLGRVVE